MCVVCSICNCRGRPNIKPSLLPSKSATTLSKVHNAHVLYTELCLLETTTCMSKFRCGLCFCLSSQAPGAVSKMPPPNSRLVKPKSTCSSVNNVRTKPLETTADSVIVANKSSRLPKVASASDTTKKSFNQKLCRKQPTCKSKLAPSTVALKKKQRTVAKENPVVRKVVPLTSSTPTTFRYV